MCIRDSRCAAAALAGLLLYLLAAKLALRLTGSVLNQYQGMDKMGSLDISVSYTHLWYNGGMEHTTLHLLYSRFWHKFLYDIGVVHTKEPYAKRTSESDGGGSLASS